MQLFIKYFDDEITKIEKLAKGDWIDLRAAEDVEMKAGEFRYLRLGVGMILPEGYEAHIAPRSSTFKNFGIILPTASALSITPIAGTRMSGRLLSTPCAIRI